MHTLIGRNIRKVKRLSTRSQTGKGLKTEYDDRVVESSNLKNGSYLLKIRKFEEIDQDDDENLKCL